MKKRISIIMVCGVLILSLICNGAAFDAANNEYDVLFNGLPTEYVSLGEGDAYYVPLRKVFELFGAAVFYRNSDSCVMALSRDGDTITHVVNSNIITINGNQKEFPYPSVLKNGETYISTDMLSAAFCPDAITFDNGKMNIQKQIFHENYHKIVEDVLGVCKNSNFFPENFGRYIKYHGEKPGLGILDVILNVNIGLDYPFYQNIAPAKNPYDLLVLVNKSNKLPDNFMQYNLVNVSAEYTVRDGKEYLLAGVAYEKYKEMFNAAKNEGLSLRIVSAYRTENYQRGLYNNRLRSSGKVYADNYSARPGHSEHQTGLAVDINSTSGVFEYSKEFKWMQKHAHEYGFILRYQKGKEWITGYSYEPWHYRFVGVEVATKIFQEGITYEEFYCKYVAKSEYK